MIRSKIGLYICMKNLLRSVPFLFTLILLAGCYPLSEEGQRLSKIGGDVMLNGFSEDLTNAGSVGAAVMSLHGQGTSTVYPLAGDMPGKREGTATHRLIIRQPGGDIVLRLRYDEVTNKYALVEYFIPRKLCYFGGRWTIER